MARTSARDEPQALSFEQILERLETVVEQLEDGEIPLEQALSTFEQGIALSRLGQKRLDDAERRIELLLQDADGKDGKDDKNGAAAAPRTRSLEEETADDE